MKASQPLIKTSIAEKGVTIDVGAGLLAMAVGQSAHLLTGRTLSSERRPQQAGSYG